MSASLHVTDAEAADIVYSAGLDPQRDARARAHAAECAECAAKLDALRASDRSAGALLILLDAPPPRRSAADLVRTAKGRARISVSAPRRAAAAIIAFMVLAGVAAAAIPSSPLHRLIVDALARKGAKAANDGHAGTAPASASSSGVSFSPSGALAIVFNSRNAGSVHLRVSDGDYVALGSTDAAATYRVGSNRITVSQQSAADFDLEIPRGLRELRVIAGGKLIFSRSPGTPMTADTLTINLSARQPR